MIIGGALKTLFCFSRQENDWVFVFLDGLNNSLGEVRGIILGKISLQIHQETFSEVKKRREMERNHDATIATVHGTPLIHVGSFMANLRARMKGEERKVVLSKLVVMIRRINVLQLNLFFHQGTIRPTVQSCLSLKHLSI